MDQRYEVLFEPVKIGPVTAPNRFYQVPHCNGTGDWSPRAVARMRQIKAEGGWGVVCTEVAEIDHSSEFHPYPSYSFWSDNDIGPIAMVADAVHEHGALAGVELGHIGIAAGNRWSRTPPLGPASLLTLESIEPFQSKAMDKADIANLRRWHRAAVERAVKAGFDIVYIYAAHDLAIPQHFLSRRYNRRGDEYGGSLENRARLLRELLEDAQDAAAGRAAIAVRFAVDELVGAEGLSCEGEGRDVVEMLAQLPDLWDVNISGWDNDSETSRFAKESFQEPYVSFVKRVTDKPVVGVGRFTSPDAMVSQIKRGILDLIGAARPSIADPWLPRKIREGRNEDIRECIGCNVCVSGEFSYSPMRCTQNPTMMEEWRRGWHPEKVEPKSSDDKVLIVGAGPAGLECALTLARRGYDVMLAEAREELGGRVTLESSLPGLAEWARVRDYRVYQLQQLGNVEIYPASCLAAEDVLETGAERLVIATGSRWRRDGIGRLQFTPIVGCDRADVFTPDNLMTGPSDLKGPVVIYDNDGAYLASALAEKLVGEGLPVVYVSPAAEIAPWTALTMEQHKIVVRLMSLGVEIVRLKMLTAIEENLVELACVHGGPAMSLPAATVVLVTSREPNDGLYHALSGLGDRWQAAGIKSVDRIGDCLAPNLIAAAVYSGNLYARDLDGKVRLDGRPYLIERHRI